MESRCGGWWMVNGAVIKVGVNVWGWESFRGVKGGSFILHKLPWAQKLVLMGTFLYFVVFSVLAFVPNLIA